MSFLPLGFAIVGTGTTADYQSQAIAQTAVRLRDHRPPSIGGSDARTAGALVRALYQSAKSDQPDRLT